MNGISVEHQSRCVVAIALSKAEKLFYNNPVKLLIPLLFIFSSCNWWKENRVSPKKEGLFLFQELKSSEDFIAKAGDFTLKADVLQEDPELQQLYRDYHELLFAQFYIQFVFYNQNQPQKVVYLGAKPQRDIKEILNQYGFSERENVDFSFGVPKLGEKTLGKVDNKEIPWKDLDRSSFLVGNIETKIYQQKKKFILKKIKNHFLFQESKKLEISVEEYLKKYVFQQISKDFGEEALKKYLMSIEKTATPENIERIKQQLIAQQEFKALDYILEKYILPLPIQLNIAKPDYLVESNREWTPHNESKNKKLEVTIFSDTQSSMAMEILKNIDEVVEKYGNEAEFLFRPVFFQSNRMQRMIVEALLCFYSMNPNSFWDYLKEILGDHGDSTEEIIYKKAKPFITQYDEFKSCVILKKSESIVKYHQDFAKYLGIQSTPVIYIGGEVYHGNLTEESFEKRIREHLGYPDAAIW